jgi:hypothetical protein
MHIPIEQINIPKEYTKVVNLREKTKVDTYLTKYKNRNI